MLKNGSRAGKESVALPHSKLKKAVLECMKKEGYVADISLKTKVGREVLEVKLSYDGKSPKISGVERISKQSRRVYYQAKNIYPVKSGTGLLVLSTPKGILSGRDARKEQVGGEALFKIW